MIAKLENQVFNLYNEKSEIIGKIKINKVKEPKEKI